MKHSRIKTALFVLLNTIGLYAQETVPATGGDAIGSGGSSSYTIGQVVYTINTGTNGTAINGVQQPYEISTITAIEMAKDIGLSFSVYPKPYSRPSNRY